VRIAGAPAGQNDFTDISLVIAISVFEKSMWRASETMIPPFTNTSEVARFKPSAKIVNCPPCRRRPCPRKF
jgi:hypothetical protein